MIGLRSPHLSAALMIAIIVLMVFKAGTGGG
jgi:hypothetical protein